MTLEPLRFSTINKRLEQTNQQIYIKLFTCTKSKFWINKTFNMRRSIIIIVYYDRNNCMMLLVMSVFKPKRLSSGLDSAAHHVGVVIMRDSYHIWPSPCNFTVTRIYTFKVKVATKRAEKFRAGKDQKENLGKLQNILCLELTAYTKVQVKHPEQTRIVKTGHK